MPTKPASLAGRFWSKVDIDPDGCWLWLGAKTTRGYGRFRYRGRTESAHRISYELANGEIPEGLQLDHTCRNPPCVNPSHLEPVTARENTLRGLKGRMIEQCPQGHEYTSSNTIWSKGRRHCRECNRTWRRRNRRRLLASADCPVCHGTRFDREGDPCPTCT